MADRPSNSNLSSWIFPLIMLFLIPPFGIVLLVAKLFSNPPKSKTTSERHPYYVQRDMEDRLGARTIASTDTPEGQTRQRTTFRKKQEKCLEQLDSKGKRLMIIGGIITALFTFTCFDSITWALRWLADGEFSLFVHEILDALPLLCFIGGGVGCLWAGMNQRKKVRRFQRCLATVGKRSMVALSDLASATGSTPKELRNDLEDMLANGLFPQGYLDYGSQRLILSNEGLEPRPVPKKEPAPAPAPTQSPEDAILSEIRAVNDDIANEKLSAQIDRIEGITAKILEYQKSRPEKEPQLHSFLSYYLPTTLKILHAYAQLEAQGVTGENITASMERIEGMMDKVVEGFEKQLDMLFQGDALDIATDVEVLEQMLSKDGLSDTKGVHLSL